MTTLTISDSLVASMAKAIREWDGCSNKDCVKGCKAFSEQDPEYVCGRQTHDYLNAIMPAFQAQMDSALLSERESATKAIIAKIERAISNAEADAILKNHPQERQGVLLGLDVLLGSFKAEIGDITRKGDGE